MSKRLICDLNEVVVNKKGKSMPLPLQNHLVTFILSWLGLNYFKEEFKLFIDGVKMYFKNGYIHHKKGNFKRSKFTQPFPKIITLVCLGLFGLEEKTFLPFNSRKMFLDIASYDFQNSYAAFCLDFCQNLLALTFFSLDSVFGVTFVMKYGHRES